MKKTILFSVCVFLFSTPLFSQAAQDGLLKQMGKEACQEISKVSFANKSAEEVKLTLGLALITVAGKHQAEMKAAGFDLSDPQSGQKFGTAIGVQLASDCPEFIRAMMNDPNTLKDLAAGNKGSSSGSISGTLIKIVDGDFSYLQVADSKGKVEKLWWMEFFEGSNTLAANPQGRLNKPIKVNYVEKEMFNSMLKDYVKVKVITGIE